MAYQTFTPKEEAAILMEWVQLRREGKEEEAHKTIIKLPLSACVAKVMKEKVGADFLINGGYNLAEAEAKFGPDWLTS